VALASVLLVGIAPGQGAGASGEQSGLPEVEAEVLWAVGDGADGSEPAKRLARRIARDRPDRFLYLGDVYERGTAEEFRRNFAGVYGRLAPITEPTPGNHEWARRREGYYPYWRRVKGRRQPPWYAFRLGEWEVLSLNSEAAHGARSRQLRWLRGHLRGVAGDCRLAFWHRPRFSAGTVYGDAPDLAPLWEALVGHASLVLSGHEHDLQRFRPRDGIVQIVAGAGRRALYPLGPDRRLAFGRDDRVGALRIELQPGRALLEFRDTRGRVLDDSSVSCR
jgi:hypothetical protein